MKITIDIGNKDYTFEMNRFVYKQLLMDEHYAKMQNELSKMVSEEGVDKAKNSFIKEGINEIMLRNMIMEEQVFYYALKVHQPQITFAETSELMDLAYEEYGREAVSELTNKLMENFTPVGETTKKKMVMRMN